jgi:hypothetical protein
VVKSGVEFVAGVSILVKIWYRDMFMGRVNYAAASARQEWGSDN